MAQCEVIAFHEIREHEEFQEKEAYIKATVPAQLLGK